MKNNNNLKEQVKEKAAELFFKHGPKHVPMEEVAERSGISKKTLYQLFHNKNTLVQEVVDDLVRSHRQVLETALTTCNDAIDGILKQDDGLSSTCKSIRPRFLYELEIFYPDIWKQLEGYKIKVHGSIEDNLRRGKSEGLYREDLNIRIVSDIRLQQLANLLRPHVLTSPGPNTKERVDEFTLLYLRAITTEKGRRQLHKYVGDQA
jgi:TetR/AcrR family transcriptional regulator, cholesterol catabolism regulator